MAGEPIDKPSSKSSKRTFYILVAVFLVTSIVIIAYVALPPLKGIIAQAYLHNGDYIEYDVNGTALFIPVSGDMRVDISNVSNDGFTATITTSGIMGDGTDTMDLSWDGSLWGVLDLGSKVGTAQISTPWGLKTVDKYFLHNSTGDITTYMGANPEVVYLVEIEGPIYVVTVSMVDTNIQIIKDGNI